MIFDVLKQVRIDAHVKVGITPVQARMEEMTFMNVNDR